jgi:hypothetical protein
MFTFSAQQILTAPAAIPVRYLFLVFSKNLILKNFLKCELEKCSSACVLKIITSSSTICMKIITSEIRKNSSQISDLG